MKDTIIISTLRVVGLCAAGIGLMIWHQPPALLRSANRLERLFAWIIHEMRVRAWAKDAAMSAYRATRAHHALPLKRQATVAQPTEPWPEIPAIWRASDEGFVK